MNNLRKFENLQRLEKRFIDGLYNDEGDERTKTQIKPYLCKGILFTIMVSYEVDSRYIDINEKTLITTGRKKTGRALLQIIRHNND